jgi:hypothetical protein
VIQFLFGANDRTTDTTASNGTSVTLAKPVNISDGDLLVAVVFFQNANGTPAITPPSGWTRVGPAVPVTPLRPSGIYLLRRGHGRPMLRRAAAAVCCSA